MEKIKILFICVENSFRSQMAEALANHFFSDRVIAESAGSRPKGEVHPNAIKVLQEIGIDTSKLYSKGFNELREKVYDYVVTMGCKDTCPFYPAKKFIEWNFPDIKNEPIEKIRELRDKIKESIKDLIEKEG